VPLMAIYWSGVPALKLTTVIEDEPSRSIFSYSNETVK